MRFFGKNTAWDGSERRNKDRLKQFRMENITKLYRISNFRKRLLIYFVLIIFVTLSVGIQLIFEVGSNKLQNQIAKTLSVKNTNGESTTHDMTEISAILTRLQQRMILIMTIVFVCIIATMFVFIRNIVEPLDALGKSAKRIAEGHLDETIPIRCNDEIGNISELINDLAVNLQEVLLHVWNHTCQDIVMMDHVAEIIHAQPGEIMPKSIKDEFDFVRRDIEEMQEIVKAFDYYNIHFEGNSLVGNEIQEPNKLSATAVTSDSKNSPLPIIDETIPAGCKDA